MIHWLGVLLLAGGCAPKVPLPQAPSAPVVEGDLPAPRDVLDDAAGASDPSTRGRALAHLVRLDPTPGATSWAQRGLWDPEPWVQGRVVDALAERLDEPESVEVLVGFVARDNVDPYPRARAGLALVGTGPEAVGDALSAAWRAERGPWRRAPLALAARAWGDADALAPLAAALERGEIALDADFFLQIARSGQADLVPSLTEGMAWAEPELVLPYAVARLGLGDRAAEAELRRALGAGEEEALTALDHLVGLEGATSTELIRRARAPDGVVGWYATLALIPRGEGEIERLLAAMGRPEREVREIAMRFAAETGSGLARRDERALRDALRIGLSDEDATVRLFAAAAASRVGGDEEVPWLHALLSDDYPAVRVEAAAALISR